MPPNKGPNILPIWGNESTMNLNPMILTNIQSSPYFKVQLFQLKTYHEVIDEIYNKVDHLEPWERGSRRTAGQTGMCGGVRGVGAGGIVSTAFCILYKLYTLRLTRKQVVGLMNHADSPYIRGLGFMYIRYTQPPPDLLAWFEEYLDDDEEVDVKAGGGCTLTIGEMLRQWLTKLEWYSTMFPRIPVPVAKQIQDHLNENPAPWATHHQQFPPQQQQQQPQQYQQQQQQPAHRYQNSEAKIHSKPIPDEEVNWGEAAKQAAALRRQQPPSRDTSREVERKKFGYDMDRSRSEGYRGDHVGRGRDGRRSRSREGSRSKQRKHRNRSGSHDGGHRYHSSRSRSPTKSSHKHKRKHKHKHKHRRSSTRSRSGSPRRKHRHHAENGAS